MQTMTVVALSGEAWVRDVDGKLRALQEGDAVEVGDVIVTAVGTTLELAEQNGVNLLVPGGTQVALSELLASLSDASRVDAEAVDDQGDHSDTAEHDASPLTPQPLVEIQNTHSSAVSLSNDAGFSFVRVERIELPLKPLAFDYGYERSHLLDTPEGGSPGRTFDGDDHGVSVVAPSNTEATTPDSNVTDQVVFESGLTGGSAPNASDTQANGQFTLTAIDGLAKTGAVAITYTDVNGDPETLSLGKAQVEGLGSSSQTLTTQYGELVLNGVSQGADGTITIDYAYTLTSAPDVNGDNASDTFTVTVTDRDGDSKSGDLSIKIVDDTPVAKDDANGIAEDVSSVAGNVVTNDVAGADGATVTGITSTNMASNTATNTNGVLEIEGQYGTLTIEADGSYSYALDNSNLDVQGLTPGESLDEVFNYTLTDGDGDEASANLTITIGGSNDGVTVTVPSDTTATSPDGDRTDQVVFESGLADGSAPNALDTQVSSQFTLKAPDGLAENGAVTIGYTDVNGDPQTLSLSKAQVEGLSGTNQTLTTQYGELVLNGVSQGADGTLTIDYDYTLTCAPGVAGDATNDSFSITASDRNGDSHSDDLTIKIVDDAPQARDDANGITEDAVSVAGNVIAGTDGTGTQDADPTQADTTGADGATVTGVSSSNVAGNTATESNGTLVIEGQYGTLTLEADGSYSYVLDNSNLEVQGLIAGESLDEVFNYALTDGDTDVRSANLTLTINGSNDGVTVDVPNDTTASIPDADSTDQVVFESGLADGSAPSAADTQVSSQFTLTALDGLAETGAVTISYIDVNGQPATLSLSKAQVDALGTTSQNITTEYGELVLNGVSQGADGTLTIDYDYTLITAPSLDVEAANDSFTIAATDRDGDTNSDNLTIKIVDDAPVARDDTNSVTEDGASTTTGNVLGGTGVSAGDVTDTPGADGATLAGVTAGVVNTEIIGNLGSSVAGSYGSLVLGTDGVYTYVLNNDDARVNALKDGESLSDIFSYTFKDADGDWSTATITITINGNTDGAPTIAPVDGNGDDSSGVSAIGQATVSEAGLADNSNSHKTDGTLTLTAPDGLASISIGGTKILVSQLEALQPADATTHITIITPLGKLTLTGFTADAVVGGVPVKGTVHYDYELSSPYNNTATAEADNGLDRIDLVVTDVKEASNSGELVVNILDDVPVANADTGTVTEDGAVLEGNVITDAGSGKDVVGADNATAATVVTGVAKGSATGEQSGNVGGTGVTGDYGTLVLNAAGSYSYTLDNDNATVNALKDGETLTETFSYTIKDADGDWSTTILTITIDGTTDGAPSIAANDTTAGVYGDITVKESGLTDGTDASSDSEATNGTITITAPDGLQSITVGGQSFTLAQLNALATTPQTVAVDGGTLELTDFTASSSVGGVPTAGALDYTYTLTDEQTHSGAEDDPLTLKIPLSVTDAGSATTNGTLTVQVEDDAPQAFVDTGSVSEGATLTVTATDGVLSNDTAGADGWDTDGAVIGVAAGNTGTASSGGVAGRIDGQYGYLTLNADGSYEYVSTADAITGDEQDVFTYTVRDGDGDETTATLTINVADVSLAETPITESVNESGLSGGSTDGDSSQIATGTVTLPAGVEAVPQTNVSTGYGEFSIDKDGNYTYTLTDTTSGDAITDSFEYTTQDADGNTVTNTVTISIVDDVPVAQDDTHSITEDATPNPVSGNVLIGGVAAGDAADTQGADGAVVTGAQAGSVAGPIADGNLATAISGQYGTLILQANGGYTYQLDNSNPAVNALKDNDTLADTFSYTLTDGDGDQSTATITITINGNTDGDPSVTIADNNGAAAGDHSIAEDATSPVTGSFTVSAPDGLKSVQVGSKTLTPTDLAGLSPTTPVTVNGTEGALTLIGYNANTGEITYEYQQSGTAKDHRGGDNSVSDSFTITVTDNSDVTSSDALDILITDTAPVAEDDANSITEDSTVAASGNVIGGPNASANDAADTVGADGATVTAIASNNVSGNTPSTNADGDLVIDGEYGTLTIKSDGSYDYVLDNTNLNVQGLLAGENLSETFTYTLTDGDGDTADAILDLTINGANDGVTVTVPVNDAATTPDGDNTDHVVFESGLADGSNPSATDTQVDSSFTLTALDGLAADGGVTLAYINVNGEARTLSLSKAQVEALATQSQTIDTQYGELVLNGYQQAVDGTITIDYNYTLERAPQVAGADTRDNIAITVTDRNGDSNSQSGNVTIKVVDDAPSAVDDANSITEDAVPNSVSGNVVTNDTVGADGANVTAITSTNAPGNTATNTADVLEIVGEFGTLTINPDGSYTYALDNDNLVVQGLSENQTLTDTFTYTLTDGDTDTASADLVITINGTNDGVTLDVPVDTTATTPDGDTTDQVVFESGLTGGSNPNAADTQVASSFTLKALDGLAATDAVTIAYTDANGDAANLVLSKADIENLGTTNQTITTQYGELVLNGYAQAADGTITVDYEYTLTNAPAVDATDVTDSFGITAKDDGVETETATQNLDIKIVDDAPTAVDDASSITEDSTVAASGNVIGGANASANDAADTVGADGATVTAIASNNVSGNTPSTNADGDRVIDGEFGTLTIKSDGSYDYVLDNTNLNVQGLLAGESLSETFTYTLTDGDGDTADAILDLTINGADDGVTVTVPADIAATTPDGDNTDHVVFESGLADGSNPSATDTQVVSNFTLKALDGLATDGGVTLAYTNVNGEARTLSLSKAQVEALATQSQTIDTQYGELVLNGYQQAVDGTITIDYNYTLERAPQVTGADTRDNIAITVTDRNGDSNSQSGNVTIKVVDDAPSAVDDAYSITEDAVPNSVSGNVVTNDTVGADGANVTAITSTNAPGNTATNTADVLEIVGEFGTLTINPDGSYTYALDNDNLVVQGLSENQTLTDTFTYTLTDGDTDTASADLVITINGTNDGVTLDVPVDTTATTPDGDTTDQVVFESGLTGGSNPNAADTQVASSFTLKALDGLAATDAVTIAYTDANGDAANLVLSKADIENLGTTNQTITTQYGELVLNGYAQAADGTITVDYEYTLTNAPAVDATDVTDSFGITAKDDGVETETATQNLDIKIVDDAPTAVDDANSITEDSTVAASGNVIGGANASANDAADTVGADGATVTGVTQGSATGEQSGNVGGTGVAGDYGTLVLNADGTYSYTLDNDNATVNALKDGDTLTETFSYTIKDADGDWSTTTLTITIDGKTDGAPSIAANDTTAGVEGHITVKESGLTDGTDASSDSESAAGTLTITAADGLQSITVGGQSFTLAQLNALATTPQTVAVDGGTLELTGFTASSSVGGIPTAGTLDYTYTLTGEQEHSGANDDALTLDIPLSVTDAGNATTNGTLTVRVEDDAPTAVNDSDVVPAGSIEDITGNVVTNDAQGADGASVTAILSGTTGTATAVPSIGTQTVDGTYGKLTIHSDGSYTYARNPGSEGGVEDVFTYTLADGDADSSTATLTIDIADSTPTTSVPAAGGATTTVYESGLNDGTEAATSKETVSGTISFTAKDGLNSTDPITLGGHVLTTSDQTFADGLTARYEHNASTGEGTIYYSYTLPAATSGDDTSAQFALVVSDADGDAAPASNLVINIVDDQPVARVDSGDVTEGATLNMDASSGVLSNDTAGADGWANSGNAVVGVVAGTSTAAENANVGQAIAGTYGTLTLRADGSYTYESTANAVTSDAQDVFTYTVKDSDGDLVETTLTINVADVTATPTNTSGQVDEAGLANGTDSSSTSEQITGGSLNLQTNWNVNGEQSGNTGLGTWTVKADGTFDYTLTSNTKDEAGRPETDSFTYTAKDQYGNTVTNTVTITIVDDAPLVALSGTSPGSVTVDESNFAAGSVSATHADFVSDVFDINHGADSAAATDGTVYSLSVTNGTASGVTDTATSTNIYLFMDGTDVVGRVGNNASGTEAFRIEINSNTGAVTLTQNRPLKHPDINNHDDALSVTDGAIKLEATVKDGDGDTAKASVNIGGKFNFKDDGPSVDGQPAKSIVDEKYLASGSEAGEGVTSVTAALPVDAGKDGMGSLVFSADQDDLLNTLKLTGNTGITLTVNDNVLTATRDGAKVFTVTLDKDTGKYKFELKGALTHPSAVSGNFDLSFNYEIKDADGDTAPGKFVVNVVDDAPKSDISITTPEDTPFGPFTTSADSTKDNVSIQDADGNNAASAATLPDGVTDIPAGTAGYNVGHGIVVVDANGQVTYHPNTDYSNNGSEDGFKVTVSNDDGSNTVTNVTVNVTPVSDAPNIPHANDGASDVDAITVTTQEGTSVPLGLKTPVITDKTDKNGSGKTGDDPERLGAITLTPDASAPNGTLLTKGDDTPLTANPDGSYTIVIVETSGETDVDTGLHLSGGLPTENVNYLTRTEYEAIQAKPADDRHENFDVVVSVDSYEVDGSGNKLPDAEVDGTNGSNSQQTITVDVLAVTDAPAIALTAPADPTTVGATSLNVADASGTDNAKITAAMEEDGTLDLQSVLGETLKDADGSESYWYDISGLPEGTVVTINGKAYTAGADGKIEMPEADYLSADDGGNPTFSIKPPQDYSNSTADNMTITLYTKDSDSDSTVTTTAESASVDLELRVYAKPDDVKLQNPEATPEDTAVGLLNSLALKDTDGSESITQVRITDLPSEGGSWTLIDHNGNEVAIPSGGDATSGGLILTVGTGAGEYTLEQIQQFTIKPPAHSSLDGTMTVYVTTEEAAAYTQSGNTESKEWAHDQAIVVTPVAEVTTPPAGGDTDSDGNTTPDLTMTSGYNYSNSGLEDTWFSLNSDGFNLKTDWANEDASEQTFARLTPYDGKDVALEGAYFQYHNGTTTVDVAYNGTPVDIPMEYLDTVRFKGPNNFKGEVKIKVEAVTLDKDADDNSVTVEAVSGEALLTNVILDPVADQVTLKVNARITASEDTPNIPLTINPTSGDPDETFNITIKGIPAGASITYKGVTYSVGNGLVDDGNGRYQLELSNFDKAQQPTLTPPKDSNETINLTVSAVSVDTLGDTTSTSAAHELPVTITLIGVPDTPNMVVAESPSYVEQTLDNADNTVALHELITSLSSGETSNDGSETLTLRISGLPEGFALLGAGAVVGAGTGSARVWVVKPDQIADGTVKIQLPANYSGTVNFTAQPVVTENDNPSETFFDAQNVEFQVTPSPEASLKVASSIAEDQVGRIDLSPVYQNGDNDEVISVVRIQAVEGLALFSDAAGTKPLTAVDGWYEITGVDAVKSIYAKASANFSGDIPLTVKYKVTDTAQDNTTGPVETADFKDGSHTLQVQPVTDAVLAEVASINGSNVNDQTAISHTATQPGDVTVSLNISKQPDSNANDERDYDGSEAITHILIQNVPEGVAVKGGIYTGDGQWLLPVTTAFNGDITQDVVFSVGRQAGGLTNSAITITVATQDGTASPEKDSISWQLTTDFTKGSNEQTLPTISLSEVVDSQTEDDDFALNKVVSAAVDTTGANQSNYSMTLTLRTSPDDETSFSGNGMLRTEVVENGQTVVLWTMTVQVNNGDNPQTIAENLLAGVTVTPPADANRNANNLNGKLPLDVTLTLHDSGLESEAQVAPQVTLDPVTDSATVAISAAAVAEGEPVAISVTVSNPSDQTGDWSIVDGKLYLKLDGTDIPGVLKQGDTELKLENVANVSGLDDGQYYVIGGVSPDTPLDLTYVPNKAYDSGTITLKGWVQNQEAGSVVELASGSGGLTVYATNTRPDITLSAAGTEHDGEIRTQAEIQVNGTVLPDEDETLQAAFIEGLPKEFTLYYGSDANSAGLANNAGGGTWQIPLSNGELPAYLAIQPPAYWSGTLSGLKLYLVGGETGNTPTSWPFDFEVVIAPRADGVELSPTLSFGDAGDIIDLNLNAAMKDPVATNTEDPADSDQHIELTTLELEGLPDGEKVVFYVNDTELAADRVSFDSNTNTHTITGLTQDELDGLGVLHLGTGGAIDINVKAWTQEATVAEGTLVGDKSGETTGTIKVNVADKLPTTGNDNLLWTGSPIDARGGEDTIQLRYGENLIGSDLATNLDNIETLDLSIAGRNAIGSNSDRLRAEDVLEMTDDDNALKILGDGNDSVHLDSEWGDPSTPDTDGFVSYTAEVNNVEVILKIDESVTIIE